MIKYPEILWDPGCRHGLFPQEVTTLLSQRIDISLIIVHDGLVETALQFFQRHASRLCCRFGIVDTVR